MRFFLQKEGIRVSIYGFNKKEPRERFSVMVEVKKITN